jgi:hypothetical protein
MMEQPVNHPAVTFEHASLVYFRILGQKPESEGSSPRVRNDGGLVLRFLEWMVDSGVTAAVHHSSGGGIWTGGFFPADAVKVRAWLLEQNASPTMEFDGWQFGQGVDDHGTEKEPEPGTPWTLRTFEEVGYVVRYKLRLEGSYMSVEAYLIVGDYGELEAKGRPASPDRPFVYLRRGATTSGDVVDDLAQAGRWLHGDIKWDGCSNFSIDAQDDCMLHFCGRTEAVAVGALLGALYDLAHEVMPRTDW